MAPYIKGGVWTNVEDEVLKAGIAKYGLNQWGRVSTLLNQKTAKQCKARWYEWLSPTVKKSEWTREEDEKLLTLAKLMPSQWRSIAPKVGRTAAQCIERYQKLLDDADQKESGLGLTTSDSTASQGLLDQGDMDMLPEVRPARPDAVDMDDEEKEMLSEARARLANTQGKKAKRRERERLLEQSHRMSLLQKKRDLRNAGINTDMAKKVKKGEIDFAKEIPFQRAPAAGLYDTSEEQAANEKAKAKYDQMVQVKGLQLGKKPEKKRKNDDDEKKQSAAQQAAEARAEKLANLDTSEQLAKRRKLDLPAPKASFGSGGDSTPIVPAEDESIYQKTRDLKAMTETQSSLLGGEEAQLYDTTFTTDHKHGRGDTAVKIGAELELVEDDLPRARSDLRAKFAALPKPKNDFELAMPDEEDDEEVAMENAQVEVQVQDQADKDREVERLRQIEHAKELERRSQAVKLGLAIPSKAEKGYRTEHKAIEDMIAKEMEALIVSDRVRYEGATAGRTINHLDDELKVQANRAIEKEVRFGEQIAPKRVKLPGMEQYSDQVAQELTDALTSIAGKSNKMEEKLKLVFGGYIKRQTGLKTKLDTSFTELMDLRKQAGVYSELAGCEQVAIANRTSKLQEQVDFLVNHERDGQERYKYLQSLL